MNEGPLSKGNSIPIPKVITFGEIMLRLNSYNHERLFQSPILNATFAGAEANVAISLANFGIKASYITALPSNPMGNAVISFLKSFDVDTSCIIRMGNRLGIFFLEPGSGPRPSNVIYDRDHSSITECSIDSFDFDTIFLESHADWFHITGITPALSQNAADISLNAVKSAKKLGLKVSCDLNYRSKLWKYGKTAPEIMREIVPFVDILIANEEDVQKSLGIMIEQNQIDGNNVDGKNREDDKISKEKYEELSKMVLNEFPNVKCIAITLRESFSADYNDWSAMCRIKEDNTVLFSKKYSLRDIVDRVGGGDAFAAGFIYSLLSEMIFPDALEFAVAASALKHTIPGDVNRVSVDEVKNLLRGNASGRVQR